MRGKNDDNSATQRSIGHDIREFPRGREEKGKSGFSKANTDVPGTNLEENDDNSATQRSIGHDIREFPRGREEKGKSGSSKANTDVPGTNLEEKKGAGGDGDGVRERTNGRTRRRREGPASARPTPTSWGRASERTVPTNVPLDRSITDRTVAEEPSSASGAVEAKAGSADSLLGANERTNERKNQRHLQEEDAADREGERRKEEEAGRRRGSDRDGGRKTNSIRKKELQ